MSVCDFCGERVGMHEIIDDHASCGMAMVCDICFARSGGVFAEMTDERMGEIIATLVADADTGYRGMIEDRHLTAARKIVSFLSVNSPGLVLSD